MRWALFAEALAPTPGSVRHDDQPPFGLSLSARQQWGEKWMNARLIHDALFPADED